jgi:hypothetical protein
MLDSESVTSFLSRFTQIKDELVVVGEITDPGFMVRTALNSFTKPWGPFVLVSQWRLSLKSHRLLPSQFHFSILFPAHLSHSTCPSTELTYFWIASYLVGRRG